MEWNETSIAHLRELIEVQKMSASQAGDTLHVSRNAIIGAANRNGVTMNAAPGGRKPGAPRSVKEMRPRISHIRTAPVFVAKAATSPLPFLGLELMQLKLDSCRYPEGDEHILFCGQPQDGETSYCAHHRGLCQYQGRPSNFFRFAA